MRAVLCCAVAVQFARLRRRMDKAPMPALNIPNRPSSTEPSVGTEVGATGSVTTVTLRVTLTAALKVVPPLLPPG